MMYKQLFFVGLFFFSINSILTQPLEFDFRKFNTIRSGKSFFIYKASKKSPPVKLGKGKIHLINAKSLLLQFSVSTTVYSISGNVNLQYTGKSKNKYRFKLKYKGLDNGVPKSFNEIVFADQFLANNGIFTIHFSNKKRFLQMSINSRRQNRLITEWGSAILK